MKLQGAMLFVSDIDRMADFYSGVMGFRAINGSKAENWIEFDTGECRFALHQIPGEYPGEDASFQPREELPIRLDFTVTDVASERARLEALGVKVLIRPWGACDAVDPEGNLIGLRAARGKQET
jgi:catechol 2,3-dioxygenase-like lactoylglutathione lyase family enzyme